MKVQAYKQIDMRWQPSKRIAVAAAGMVDRKPKA